MNWKLNYISNNIADNNIADIADKCNIKITQYPH